MIDERNNKEMRVELYISRREYMILKRIANQEGHTLLEYVTNIVRTFANAQLQGEYRKMFQEMNVLEYANLFGDVKKDGTINKVGTAVEREKKEIKEKYKDQIKEK